MVGMVGMVPIRLEREKLQFYHSDSTIPISTTPFRFYHSDFDNTHEPVVLGVKKVFKENSWKTTAKLCVRTFYSASIVVNGDLQWGPQDSYN